MAVDPETKPVGVSDVVRLAQRLVRIQSENPPGHTREVCEAVADELQGQFTIEMLESEPDIVSVLARQVFSDDGRV